MFSVLDGVCFVCVVCVFCVMGVPCKCALYCLRNISGVCRVCMMRVRLVCVVSSFGQRVCDA